MDMNLKVRNYYTYILLKNLGISNLFLISTLVSDIWGKQESVKTSETAVGMMSIYSVQRVGSWESQDM